MPSQLIHLAVCADAAGAGRRGDGAEGDFLLGAIAPDAWAVGGVSRAATHFWDSANDLSGAGKLREAHPEVGDPAALESGARAFMAGYLCHLVTDEQWTFTVYRPYFGRYSAYGASPEGRKVQWALQALMEQRLRDRRAADLGRWLAALAGARGDVAWPFLPAGAAAAWRTLLLEACELPTAGEAFLHFRRRVHGSGDPSTSAAASPPPIGGPGPLPQGRAPAAPAGEGRTPAGEGQTPAEEGGTPAGEGGAAASGSGDWRLAAEWPALTERAAALVPDEALDTFRARAADACAAVLAEWWGAAG